MDNQDVQVSARPNGEQVQEAVYQDPVHDVTQQIIDAIKRAAVKHLPDELLW